MKNTCFLLFFSFLYSCNTNPATKTLKLAHGLSTDHPVHQAFEFLQEEVARLSDGKMKIKIYPAGQLGAEKELLELLQIGSIDITKVSGAVMEGFVPEYKLLSLPYLFKSKAHSFRALDGEVGRELLRLVKPSLLHGLCFYDAGARSFYTKDNPVNKPEDLQGLKIRVQKSFMAVGMVNGYGASATPIAWGELYMTRPKKSLQFS